MASKHAATALLRGKRRAGFWRPASGRRPARTLVRRSAQLCRAGCLLSLALVPGAALAASNKVRISNLSDLAFGTIANLNADAIRSESLCLYADTATDGYNITASGTGPGAAFQLTSGAGAMAYEVQWSSSAGQSVGTQLSPNVPLTGQVSAATQQTCNNGPATTASLIVVLRSAALSSATAGAYNGTLTLLVGPE